MAKGGKRPEYYERYESAKIEYLNGNIDLKCIAKMFKLDLQTFRNNLTNEGYVLPNKNIDAGYDDRLFEHINTEEKAYWFGFLYADGNVSQDLNKFELTIKDEEHVVKFKEFLNCSNSISVKIVKGKPYYRISKRSKNTCLDFYNKGLVPAKSLIKRLPDNDAIPEHLYRHFMRGYFDGNGCIFKTKSGILLSLDSSECFLKELKEKYNLPYKIIGKVNSKSKNVRTACRADVLKILEWMYSESTVYLDRKYESYKNAIAVLMEKS